MNDDTLKPDTGGIQRAAQDLYEKAIDDAKAQIHPLLQNAELRQLERRVEFMRAFKLALEQRIAHRLAAWQPGVRAVFQFDESWAETRSSWDGSIHLLVKVPHLLKTIRVICKRLDVCLLRSLKASGLPRFQGRRSILEIQQVTLSELAHGVSYGAMFSAAYSIPVKVWPTPTT